MIDTYKNTADIDETIDELAKNFIVGYRRWDFCKRIS